MSITTVPSYVDLTAMDTFAEGIPHELFGRLRREAPIAWHPEANGPGFWCITRHADVVAANRDTETMSTARGGNQIFDRPEIADPNLPRMMIDMDPPQHTRYRLLVNRGFTPRTIAKLEDFMRDIAARTVERVIDRGEADFVDDIAAELPVQVIAHLMGVPEHERPKLLELSNQLIDFADPAAGELGGRPADRAGAEMYELANRLGEEKRAALDAGAAPSDIASVLLAAEVDGDRLSELEYDMFFLLLSVAGNETTRTAVTQGMLAFIENPDEWDRLRVDRSLVPTAVEEILRYTTPVFHFRRTAKRDGEVAGHPMREGDKVVFWYASANYDEQVFADPLRFDVGREPNEHVTFGGGGPHFCLGANLARLELTIMFEQLLDRFPRIELAGPVERLRSNFNNGIRRMPVRWSV